MVQPSFITIYNCHFLFYLLLGDFFFRLFCQFPVFNSCDSKVVNLKFWRISKFLFMYPCAYGYFFQVILESKDVEIYSKNWVFLLRFYSVKILTKSVI